MKQILKDGGATREFYISDLVTHVIAIDTDFSQHQETTEFSLPVVKVDVHVQLCIHTSYVFTVLNNI